MKISCAWTYAISKYGYPPSIEDTYKALREMADLGFKYVELEGVGETNLMEVFKNKEKFKILCNNLGIKVSTFYPILPDMVSLEEAKRKKALELFDIGTEIANYFGCQIIQADSYAPPIEFVGKVPYKETMAYGEQYRVKVDPNFKWEELWKIFIDSTVKCNQKAKEAGLKFSMEPRVGEIASNTDALLRLMDAVGDENFGALLDTAHLHAQKEILPLSVEKLGNRIYYVHVSDNDGRVNEHLGLGKGTIDWRGVFVALKKHRFNGYVAVDVGEVDNIEEEYKESKKFLENIARELNI